MSDPLAERQPAARRPGASPLSAAGLAVAVQVETPPSSRSEQRDLRRSAASPPGWNRSAGPDSSDSLTNMQGLRTEIKICYTTTRWGSSRVFIRWIPSTLQFMDLLNASFSSSLLLFWFTRVLLLFLRTAGQRQRDKTLKNDHRKAHRTSFQYI